MAPGSSFLRSRPRAPAPAREARSIAAFRLGDIRRGGALALAAAVLFGASTPAAKVLGEGVAPAVLAGLLYLGSGLGLAVLRLVRGDGGPMLSRRDLPWLAGTVLFGGGLGPLLLMAGLSRIAGSTASLLLTLEGVFTASIAWLVFGEPFNRRIGLGMAAIFAGALTLALAGRADARPEALGVLAVAGACLCWGLDNNFTQKLSHANAVTVAAIKGLAAGAANLGLALAFGEPLPGLGSIGVAALVGFVGYGVSLTLFVLALREVGAARAGAYFACAPFIGAAVGVQAMGETITPALAAAGGLMATGVWLHLTEPPPIDV